MGFSHTNVYTLLQSASKCFHSEIPFLPPYHTLSFCHFFPFFSFTFVTVLSLILCVHALRKSKRDSCLRLPATVLTHTHTSSKTDCRLIKGTTYLLSTHTASHLNRLPGKLDTRKTITGLRICLNNV